MMNFHEGKRTLPKGPAVVSAFSYVAVKNPNPAAGIYLMLASFRSPTGTLIFVVAQLFVKDLIKQQCGVNHR